MAAGIARAILLEEPLAAFYAWLSDHEKDWQRRMQDGQIILVCDVGGGTTDFSLLGVRSGEKGLRFNRLAVGEHLMLGGDNMDFTLGRYVETEMTGRPGKLDAQRWHQLTHQCRRAKELLLGAPDVEKVDVAVLGSSGKLIAGTLKGTLTREDAHRLLLDGFFPDVDLDEPPLGAPRAGLTELGLPYVHDPAVTRHLAAFWKRFRVFLHDETGRAAPFPDFVLFNGGALAPASVRDRLRAVIGSWFRREAGADWQPAELENPNPELAVATGAAYYGLVRLGEGTRVGSGSPRAYYISVETRQPGREGAAHTAVCLVPRGMEEGFETRLEDLNVTALTNQPVAFQVFSSSTRLGDRLGEVTTLLPDEVSVLPPIRTVLRYGKKGAAQKLPVQIAVRLTEIGVLELWCQSVQTEHRWQLQFDVRQSAETGTEARLEETLDQRQVEAAQALVRKTFSGAHLDQHPPARLRRALEEEVALPREQWPVSLIRSLADAFLEMAEGRKLTAQHEERWYNLAGYCLRPGFGDPVDEWRMKQAWKLYFEGIQFHRQVRCRSEWWIFWRRVAGGLSAGQQQNIYHEVKAFLQPEGARRWKPGRLFPEKLGAKEELELWMALANFERLPASARQELGRLLLQRMKGAAPQTQEYWALSRLGGRTAMYGPLDRLIPASEAAAWVSALLSRHPERKDGVAHALVHLAQFTGDRARDVPEETRAQVVRWLRDMPGGDRYTEILQNAGSSRRREEQDWVFGEALPAGLVLSAEPA